MIAAGRAGAQHTAMPNTSTQERRAVIMGWVASATRWPSPHAGPLFTAAHEQRLVECGRMTPLLKALTAATFAG